MRHQHAFVRVAGIALAIPTLVVGAIAAASAIPAEPDVTPAKVQAAFEKATEANEKVNAVVEKQSKAKKAADDLSASLTKVRKRYERNRSLLGESIAQTHLENPLGPTTSLLASSDQRAFLDSLRTIDTVNSTRSDLMQKYESSRRAYEYQLSMLHRHQKDLAKTRDDLEETRDDLRRAHERAQSDLARLSASQQNALNGGGSSTLDFTITASGNAKKAIDFALAQLGDRYVYGGTGPDGWDCSGLVQAAWRAGGVSLPRTSGSQINTGSAVSMSSLKPGDIVGFSRSGGHNGLYIGNGKVVHAPRSGKNVEIVSVSMFSVATRVG